MVRVIDAHDVVTGEKKYFEYAGVSDDSKPVGDNISTGSIFVEVDTGNVFLYDEEDGGSWYVAGGGSDGGEDYDEGGVILA